MGKIVLILLLLLSFMRADLSNEQLEEFVVVSNAKDIYDAVSDKLYKNMIGVVGGEASDSLAPLNIAIKDIVFNPKYKEIYLETFRKLEYAQYSKALQFYKTELGKKFKKVKSYSYNNVQEREVFISEFEKLEVTSEKKLLIHALIKNMGIEDMFLHVLKINFIVEHNNNYSNDELEELIKRKHDFIESWSVLSATLSFKNYSISELKKLNGYMINTGGEVFRLGYIGHTRAYKLIMLDFLKKLKYFFNIKICEKYNTQDINSPEFCKPEWLSQNPTDINRTKQE